MAETSMGISNSKSNNKLRSIDRQVSSLRSSMRSSNRKMSSDTKGDIVQTLVQYSTEAESLKNKVKTKQLQEVQSHITQTMHEVLSTNQEESDLDMGSVETSSFVQLPLSKRQMSSKDLSELPPKRQKNSKVEFAKASNRTLQEIEDKVKTLKPQIKVAIEQKDLTQLRVHQQTIKVLVTNLEMIEVMEHTPLGDKKMKLDNSIMSQYNKITKVMKEIRKEKDINYSTNQKKRTLNQLEDIGKELVEIESVFLGNKDQSTMSGLKENILMINQQLGSVQTVDESTKVLQEQLLQKLKVVSRAVDDGANGSLAQNSSQSDLTKAQMNYEEIIRNIANGHSINKDEINTKLQSLQSFINGIEEVNDSILRRKQQLLNNVRQSFSLILDEEEKIQNTEPINKQGSHKAVKELDSLYNNLKSIQKNINPSSLDDLSQMDQVLSDIEESIHHTRSQIAEYKSLPANLKKKLNQSTPNLSASKPLGSKFGSSRSVDLTDQSSTPLKTKAKFYNLSTPQIQNINDQSVVLRNKQFYKNSINPDESRPFSKIEEIKTQVNYIKEKFKESQQKQHLKNKLESYVVIINGYIHHQNQRIANNAKALLVDIQDMLKSMSHIPETMNSTSQRRASIELSFENVVGIQRAVEDMEKTVATFQGQRDGPEYKNITENISKCQKYLQTMEIPPKYDMVHQQREEILKRIEDLFNALENKCYNFNENAELANTKKKLNSLRDKVSRFSGAYKGVLYNQIEKDLNKLLVNVTESVNDKAIAEDVTKDIEKHLKILEHRATKDQSFRRTVNDPKSRNEDEEKLIKLKSDLLNIKTSIDSTPTNAMNLFLGLKSRLDLVKLGLDQLRFTLEDEEKQRDMLYNEVETLKNMVEAKISLARQAVRQWPLEQDKDKINMEELRKVEEKFKSLKPEIESFVGTTSDNKFYELDENSIRLILKMDKLQFERGSEIHNRKINLLKEIYNYGDLLDQRAKECEDLLEIERSLHDIERNFARNLKLNDLDTLQEKVVALKSRINSGQYNNNLLQRKQACIKAIEDLFGKISANKEKSTTEIVRKIDTETDPDHLISNIELRFVGIKKEIVGFSGTHSDSRYYEINSKLTALFLELDNVKLPESSELRSRKIVLLKEMHVYTEILRSKAKDSETVQEVEKQLKSINKLVDSYKGNDEELNTMENELRSIQMKLENIKIGVERRPLDEKLDILIGEYARFRKAKETSTNYIGSASFQKDVQNNLTKNKALQNLQGAVGARLAEIENEIYLVRTKISSFNNSDTSEEYRTIEDTLLRLKMRLGKLEIQRNSEYSRKQNDLQKRIEECLNILDGRSSEAACVIEIEKALDMISEKLKGRVTENEKSALDERLIRLQMDVGKLHVNKDLTQRKSKCAYWISVYLKQLRNEAAAQNQSNSGVQYNI